MYLMRLTIALLTIALAASPCLSIAASPTIAELGITFNLPQGWKYEIRELPARSDVLLKPIQDEPIGIRRCGITKHVLPDKFMRMTQEEMNRHYEEQPVTSAEFSSKLGEAAGVPVTILDTGKTSFHQAAAYWAMYSYDSKVENVGTISWIGKVNFVQTPGYAWNIRCLSASAKGGGGALAGFLRASSEFERFFSSVMFPSR